MEFAVRNSEFVSEIGLENGTRSGGGWINSGSSISDLVRGSENIAYPDIGIFGAFQRFHGCNRRQNTRESESDRNYSANRRITYYVDNMSTRPENLSVEGKYKMDIRQETAGKQGRPQEQISKSRKTENASHSKPKVGPGPWGLGWHVIDVSIIDSIFGTVPEDGRQY